MASLEEQRARYQAIYGEGSDVWLYPRTAGLHAVILELLAPELAGRRVLDVGCGAGRLSFYCSRIAAEVVGVDFSESAVELARTGAQLCGIDNVRFEIGEASPRSGPFDVILLVGVPEHLPEPIATMEKLVPLLSEQGTMLLACPGFSNLRGWSYRTLGELFGWPMSLADLWQVDQAMVDGWARALRLRCRRSVGALYHRVWGADSVKDMTKRITAAARDAGHGGPLKLEAYRGWLEQEANVGSALLQLWRKQGIIRNAKVPEPLRPQRMEALEPATADRLAAYLQLDQSGDTSWADVAPVNALGGEGIYVLERA